MSLFPSGDAGSFPRAAAAGGGGGGYELVWNAAADADWSGVTADWTGDDSRSINGVTGTIDRKANWVTFGPDGSGNCQFKLGATSNYGSGATDAPVLRFDLSDLLTVGGYSADRNDSYIFRILMASGNPDPANGNEGIGCGIRKDNSTTISAPNDSGAIWMNISGLKIRSSINGGDNATASTGLRYLSSEVTNSHGFVMRFGTSEATTAANEGTRALTFQGQTSGVDITPATPDFDVTGADVNCYVSGWGATSGVTFLISDIEFWRMRTE